jgi:hypothetical protein
MTLLLRYLNVEVVAQYLNILCVRLTAVMSKQRNTELR